MGYYVRVPDSGIIKQEDAPSIGSPDGWDEDGNYCFECEADDIVKLIAWFPGKTMLVEA